MHSRTTCTPPSNPPPCKHVPRNPQSNNAYMSNTRDRLTEWMCTYVHGCASHPTCGPKQHHMACHTLAGLAGPQNNTHWRDINCIEETKHFDKWHKTTAMAHKTEKHWNTAQAGSGTVSLGVGGIRQRRPGRSCRPVPSPEPPNCTTQKKLWRTTSYYCQLVGGTQQSGTWIVVSVGV